MDEKKLWLELIYLVIYINRNIIIIIYLINFFNLTWFIFNFIILSICICFIKFKAFYNQYYYKL
jgi:hypothetical protein